jgi:hypothetical protein
MIKYSPGGRSKRKDARKETEAELRSGCIGKSGAIIGLSV